MLTKPHRQEALCRAYVQAVAAQAGLSYSLLAHDYGIDLSLRAIGERGTHRPDVGIQLDLQLKSTVRANVGETQVTYDLDVKAYNDLRDPDVGCPRILVVLVMPLEETAWLNLSEEELTIRHCAYWVSLKGWAATAAARTVRIVIPRSQVFSVENLRALFERLRRGEEP